jgi:hypothetical protein
VVNFTLPTYLLTYSETVPGTQPDRRLGWPQNQPGYGGEEKNSNCWELSILWATTLHMTLFEEG